MATLLCAATQMCGWGMDGVRIGCEGKRAAGRGLFKKNLKRGEGRWGGMVQPSFAKDTFPWTLIESCE